MPLDGGTQPHYYPSEHGIGGGDFQFESYGLRVEQSQVERPVIETGVAGYFDPTPTNTIEGEQSDFFLSDHQIHDGAKAEAFAAQAAADIARLQDQLNAKDVSHALELAASREVEASAQKKVSFSAAASRRSSGAGDAGTPTLPPSDAPKQWLGTDPELDNG